MKLFTALEFNARSERLVQERIDNNIPFRKGFSLAQLMEVHDALSQLGTTGYTEVAQKLGWRPVTTKYALYALSAVRLVSVQTI